jgi:photosystem II stability/assembly factor-like uncharacterized protein
MSLELLSSLRARSIGPANIGGRVVAISVVERDPTTIYVGGATSGVWKSTDGGFTWTPIFDEQPTSSIGAVAVVQQSPDTVWVGTGEGKPRYGTGVGTGIYLSRDAGKTWRSMGLTASERIQRIIPHPVNPDIVYVGVVGPAYQDGEERGVYKTTDGGASWESLLFTNPRSGCGDLVMDPANPDKLIAAMWEYRRSPWDFVSGGPGSGLFVTDDGGRSWRQLDERNGIPSGILGRSGLAFAPGKPAVVYAVIEAETNGLYRSEDGGETWRLQSADPDFFGQVSRPWYDQEIAVDPTNENRLYFSGYTFNVSDDAGRNWRVIGGHDVPSVHADFHTIWIDSTDPRHLLIASDGGLYESRSGGRSWRFIENLPFGQYYQIAVDEETPYNVYGNVQDNSDTRVPSAVWEEGGIRSRDVRVLAGGEQAWVYPLAGDARYVYTSHQQGNIQLEDTETGMTRHLMPTHPDPDVKLRWSIHTGQAPDPFDPDVVYLGSQFLHKSEDRGATWRIISPDLTTNDPSKQRPFLTGGTGGLTWEGSGGEHHTTIVTIVPSPIERDLLWVGTDDGNVQLTRDGGGTWKNLTAGIEGPEPGGWVAMIDASRHDPAEAYVVIDDHRRGDFTPYLFKTSDYGETWSRLPSEGVRGNAYAIVQDPVEPRLLFLGTEFGLWFSFDGGVAWRQWTSGLPTASVRSLVIHPREHDLVIGTFGRSIYILDDIRPLRELARDPALLERPAHLFEIAPVVQGWVSHDTTDGADGDTVFVGENRPYGALLTYVGGDDREARIEISNADGTLVRTLTGPAAPGLNRVAWDLRHDSDVRGWGWPNQGYGLSGPHVLPAVYTVRVRVGEHERSREVEVLPDPRIDISLEDRRAQISAVSRARDNLRLVHQAKERVDQAVEALDLLRQRLANASDDELLARIEELRPRLVAVGERFQHRQPQALGHDETMAVIRETGSAYGLNARFAGVYGDIKMSWHAPTEAQMLEMAHAEQRLGAAVETLNSLLDEFGQVRGRAVSQDLALLPRLDRIVATSSPR